MNDDEARELLLRERTRIEAELKELAEPEGDDEAVVFDDADAAPEMVETTIDEALEVSLAEELAAIERAEARLAEGKYGLSIESGEPIADARLKTVPWAERTTEEQARLESGR
jgi:DnaK suppressor protein